MDRARIEDDPRAQRAKVEQDFDPDPPRCATCVYHRYRQRDRYVERPVKTRRGEIKMRRYKIKAHPLNNPMVDSCTFGNFIVKPTSVCNEWHSRTGERIADAADTTAGEGR